MTCIFGSILKDWNNSDMLLLFHFLIPRGSMVLRESDISLYVSRNVYQFQE